MKGRILFYLLGIFFVAFVLSGCVVRTYSLTKDRADQDLDTGNRGYLQGKLPPTPVVERKATRTTQVIEFEMHSPLRFERLSKARVQKTARIQKTEDESLEGGNLGYITRSIAPEIAEPEITTVPSFEKYTVQKNDTLQKISKKFYGTTKKWTKIHAANKDILKGPNKIYVGQILNIPVEPLKEIKENLK